MGPGWYSRVGTPSLPEPPPPPGGSRPICCPHCIPIRRISQPGGSGYRRLNDKVPPLPARPASRPVGTRSGFSTLSLWPRKNSKHHGAQRQSAESSGEAEARTAGAAGGRFCAGSTSPRPQALLFPRLFSTRETLLPAPEPTPSPLRDPRVRPSPTSPHPFRAEQHL